MEISLTFTNQEIGMIRNALEGREEAFYHAGAKQDINEDNRAACVRWAKRHTDLIRKINEGDTDNG